MFVAKVEAEKEIRRCVDTGKVIFGTKESEQSIKNGSAKLLIIAGNTPKLAKEKLLSFAEFSSTPVFLFEGSGKELGSICGKPFTASAMIVEDAGKSRVLEITKQ